MCFCPQFIYSTYESITVYITIIVTPLEKQGNERQDIFRITRKAIAARLGALQKNLTQLGGK
jgi:hypothetical protein